MGKYDAFEDDDTPYRNKETLERLYVDERLSQDEIADRLECGVATVSRWMDKHGIDARSRKENGAIQASRTPAHYYTNNRGREIWVDNTGDSFESVTVHRLLAVAEYGYERVAGNHVHHELNIPWLNTPANITPKDPTEHLRDHKIGNTVHELISQEDCQEIRDSHAGDEELASEYGVVKRTIRRHRNGRCHHD